MKETWVQDTSVNDVTSLIATITERNIQYIQNTGSKYVTGPSKSGKPNEVGIYFIDNTGSIGNTGNTGKGNEETQK